MKLCAWGLRAARSGLICLALGSFGVLASGAAHGVSAQEPVSESVKLPSKYGHVFVPAPLGQSPFVHTALQSTLGIGQAVDVDFGTLTLPSGDTLVALNGDLTIAVLSFEYMHALRDWLGVRAKMNVGARLGTDVGALLSSGVTLSTGFEVGWLAQIRETDRSLLSVSLDVRKSTFTLVDLPRWINDLIDGNTAHLVRRTPALRVGGGLLYAWVLNDVIAFTGTGNASFGEALQDRQSQWYYKGTGSVSANFRQRYGVPLGIGVTFTADSYPAVSGEQTRGWQGVGMRFAYTGRDDLMIAVTSTLQRVPFQEEDRMEVGILTFDMRYFF